MPDLYRLFDLYAADLNRRDPSYQGVMLCPLCLAPYDKTALGSRELTKEHVLPQGLGGRLITLTCRDCNHKLGGTILDSQLIRQLDVSDGIPVRFEASVKGKRFRGELVSPKHPDDPISFRIIGDMNNPAEVEEAMEIMKAEWDGLTINVTGSFGYNERRAQVGRLKIAYLSLFTYFGYEYILSSVGEMVRAQILNPFDDKMPFSIAAHPDITYPIPGSRRPLILAAIAPEAAQAIVVMLNLSTEKPRTTLVVLPHLNDSNACGPTWWKNIAEQPNTNMQLRFLADNGLALEKPNRYPPLYQRWQQVIADG